MANSIYATPNPQLRKLFEEAGDARKVLCAPIDYAKSKHTVLFCNGLGDILKQPFVVVNSPAGVAQLLAQLQTTCRRHKLKPKHTFFGGEDIPVWAENFIAALRSKNYLVARVNAWEAKKQRENFQASNDSLDLLGIAQCMLKHRGQFTPPVDGNYRRLRELSRERQRFVSDATALANRVHTYVDRLFPHFLESKRSGIPPFSPACWWLLGERFSAPQIARRRPQSLIEGLQAKGLSEPEKAAGTLQALAGQVLPPQPEHVLTWQLIVQGLASQWQSSFQVISQLDRQIAHLLAQTPGAFLTSISGIGITLAAGLCSELGEAQLLPGIDRLCSYAGIIPATEQTGGPDKAPVVLGVRHRSNHHLKNYLLQAADKVGRLGPPSLQERYRQVQDRHSAAHFVLAKDLLGISKSLMQRQAIYLPPHLFVPESPATERASYYVELWPKLLTKWRPKAELAQIFAPGNPLGQWRQMAQKSYKISLPLPQRTPASRSSTQNASTADLKASSSIEVSLCDPNPEEANCSTTCNSDTPDL
jgi:transposase